MLFISILTLIVAKALPYLNSNISSLAFTRITSIVFLYTAALNLNILDIQLLGEGIGIYSGLFQVSAIGQVFEIFLFTIGGLILMAWPLITSAPFSQSKAVSLRPYASEYTTDTHSRDYSLVVLFSSLGSSLLINSYDLISVYLSIELQSFGLYILSSVYRNSISNMNAGLKYFLLGGLSSCIILLGVGIIYSITGSTNFEDIYLINSVSSLGQGMNASINLWSDQYILQGISLGVILIFIGFLFKIAAAPLHNWSPDVYDGTNTIVTIWLSIIPKISILILLLELEVALGIIGEIKNQSTILINNLPTSPLPMQGIEGVALASGGLKTLLIITSISSLIVGSLLGLSQIRIKRLLAYSTINHIGFILIAMTINTNNSLESFLFYIFQYTIVNLNIFLLILSITYILNNKNAVSQLRLRQSKDNLIIKDITYINELKGIFFINPIISTSLIISLFSMAGIPPLIGFFSKAFVLYSLLNNGYYFFSVIAIIVSVISASYYLKVIKVLLSSPSASPMRGGGGNEDESNQVYNVSANVFISNSHSYLISTLTFIILLFFIKPSIILNSIKLLSLSLFYI